MSSASRLFKYYRREAWLKHCPLCIISFEYFAAPTLTKLYRHIRKCHRRTQ